MRTIVLIAIFASSAVSALTVAPVRVTSAPTMTAVAWSNTRNALGDIFESRASNSDCGMCGGSAEGCPMCRAFEAPPLDMESSNYECGMCGGAPEGCPMCRARMPPLLEFEA